MPINRIKIEIDECFDDRPRRQLPKESLGFHFAQRGLWRVTLSKCNVLKLFISEDLISG